MTTSRCQIATVPISSRITNEQSHFFVAMWSWLYCNIAANFAVRLQYRKSLWNFVKISNISLKFQLYSCLGGLFCPLQIQKRPKSLKNDRKIKCDCGVVAIYERHAISTVSVISRLRSLMTGRYCYLDQREALPWFSKIAPGVDPPAKRNIIL